MKRDRLKRRAIIYSAVLIMLVSASCSPVVTAESTPKVILTSTPEKLSLINGEIDACQLIRPTEVESVLGIRAISELRFSTGGAIFCRYSSVMNDQLVFLTFVTTNTTLKKVNAPYTAIEGYELYKEANLKQSEIFRVEELESIGDQAYFKEGSFLEINILNNEIFYQFVTQNPSGIDFSGLMELAQIALQRMP